MRIRPAKKQDVAQILALLNSAKELKTSKEAVFDADYVASYLNNPMNVALVCEEGSKIIGVLTAEIWDDKSYAFINDIVVAGGLRQKGVGSSLYRNFEALCKSRNLRKINFLVQTTNEAMLRWSQKQGFSKGHSFFFYEKNLEPPA